MPILSAKNLLLRIGANAPLLDNVCFDIEAGDRICLVGRNGCGKSTLLKVLTDEMEVQSGEVIKKSFEDCVKVRSVLGINIEIIGFIPAADTLAI